jgi:hypothetical protein
MTAAVGGYETAFAAISPYKELPHNCFGINPAYCTAEEPIWIAK